MTKRPAAGGALEATWTEAASKPATYETRKRQPRLAAVESYWVVTTASL
jgi:hypothetical protein